MGIGKFLKKAWKQVNLNPVKHGLELTQAVSRTIRTGEYRHVTETIREHGRSDFLGLRTREVAAVAAIAYGGYAAYGALGAKASAGAVAAQTTASGGTSAIAATSGGVAATSGGGAVVAGSSGAFGGTFLSTATKAITAGLLARGLSLFNPKAPEALPQENYYPDGFGGEIYPTGIPPGLGAGYGEPFGSMLSPASYDAPEGSGFLPSSFSAFSPMTILAVIIVIAALFLLARK